MDRAVERCLGRRQRHFPGRPGAMWLWTAVSLVTAAAASIPDVCLLPVEVGDGSVEPGITSYYYSAKDRKCIKFGWTGGKLNGNNFNSWTQCHLKCHPCLQDEQTSTCSTTEIRYRFSKKANKCVSFSWGGGCLPKNENTLSSGSVFNTMHDCRKQCCSHGCSDPCGQKLDKGVEGCYEITSGYSRRYYYLAKKNKCKPFGYTGCLGNQNNFKTLEDCKNMCVT